MFYADLDPIIGSEQGGIRPVLILQNNIDNIFSQTTIIAAAITSKTDKPPLPTHVSLSNVSNLEKDSLLLLEQGEGEFMEVFTQEKLQAMQEIDIHAVVLDNLFDIQDVKIDSSMPVNERIKSFLHQIGNPYCYKCGKYIVKVSYTQSGGSINERLESYLRSLVSDTN